VLVGGGEPADDEPGTDPGGDQPTPGGAQPGQQMVRSPAHGGLGGRGRSRRLRLDRSAEVDRSDAAPAGPARGRFGQPTDRYLTGEGRIGPGGRQDRRDCRVILPGERRWRRCAPGFRQPGPRRRAGRWRRGAISVLDRGDGCSLRCPSPPAAGMSVRSSVQRAAVRTAIVRTVSSDTALACRRARDRPGLRAGPQMSATAPSSRPMEVPPCARWLRVRQARYGHRSCPDAPADYGGVGGGCRRSHRQVDQAFLGGPARVPAVRGA
jgi:hypothetical protein